MTHSTPSGGLTREREGVQINAPRDLLLRKDPDYSRTYPASQAPSESDNNHKPTPTSKKGFRKY